MEWLKDHIKEILLSLGSAIGLAIIGYVSRLTSLYCAAIDVSPKICYEDCAIRFAVYFIISALLVAILAFSFKTINVLIAVGSGVAFLIVLYLGRFIDKDDSQAFLQSAFIIPLQLISGIFIGSLLGGLARFIWVRFGAIIIEAIEKRLKKGATPNPP